MPEPDKFALREDVIKIADSIHPLINQISNLVIELKHDRESAEKRETNHDEAVAELKVSLKEERLLSLSGRKEIKDEIQEIKERIIPVEIISETIKSIATKIIGSLLLMFIVGGVSVFALIKSMGA